MLKIEFNPDKYEIRCKGHADYESPVDRVCAASSMLFYTLAANLYSFGKDEKVWKEAPIVDDKLNDKSGTSIIKCVPTDAYATEVTYAFLFTINGYKQLEANYPRNVKVVIK